jgi:hypothetical protein
VRVVIRNDLNGVPVSEPGVRGCESPRVILGSARSNRF